MKNYRIIDCPFCHQQRIKDEHILLDGDLDSFTEPECNVCNGHGFVRESITIESVEKRVSGRSDNEHRRK